jgi:ParB family chromosome partitioning protein
LGLKVQVIHKGKKGGQVRISYKTLEQLDEINRRLSKPR